MVRNMSKSPVKGQRRSPPARHGSPASGSPSPRTRRIRRAKEDRELERSYSMGSDRGSSPKRGRLLASRSPSPRSRRVRRAKEDEEIERNYNRGSSPKGRRSRVSVSRSPSPRSRRLRRGQEERGGERNYSKGSEKGERERKSSDNRSLKGAVLDSPDSQSPSPRSRRLRRAQDEKVADRESDRSSGRGSQNQRHKGSNRDGEFERMRKERMSGGDEIDDRIRQRRSASPSNGHRRSSHRSRSPQPNHPHDEGPGSSGPEQRNEDDSVAKMEATEEALQAKEKHKPSFELSGKLAAETNRFRGVTLLFNEPPDARKPTVRWRLYVFKGGEVLNEPLYIHRQTCYLFGRERRVADIPTDHPSCSKQHAVIQYRQVEVEQPDGTVSKQVKPYLMDLGSTNKTLLNDNPIEPQRYYELFEKDTIKFGNSSREYVLLHENSVQ